MSKNMPKNMPKNYRIAVIGSTGQGDYGHGLDAAFLDLPHCEIVAVADDNAAGRDKAAARLKVAKAYADYRDMLKHEKPDIVCIGPRWVTRRVEMVTAVAAAGSHIYCEKPCLPDLESADTVRAAVEKAGIQFAMAHQWRAMPPVQQAIADIHAGKFGRVCRMRARPKDDKRGGGEELLVHGTHWFDLMFAIAGGPRWVSGHVAVGARDATTADRREGSEPAGPVAGDNVVAVFSFDRGVRGFYDSTANTAPSSRPRNPSEPPPAWDSVYGLAIECEQATIQFRQPGDAYIYPAPGVLPDREALKWQKLWVEDWHFTPEHKPKDVSREWLRLGNRGLALDQLAAIEGKKPEPLSPLRHAIWVTEMVQGTYTSHLAGGERLAIPLANRKHPL